MMAKCSVKFLKNAHLMVSRLSAVYEHILNRWKVINNEATNMHNFV